MEKNKKGKKTLSEEEILAEVKALSEKVKQPLAFQLNLMDTISLGEEDLDTTFNKETINTNADPDTSHRLYYTMMMMMRANLPKTNNRKPKTIEQENQNKRIRAFNAKIYAEKSLFLNRGKEIDKRGRRGSDERQAYIPSFLKVAYDTVHKWVGSGANPWDLFLAFYELNKERSYRK